MRQTWFGSHRGHERAAGIGSRPTRLVSAPAFPAVFDNAEPPAEARVEWVEARELIAALGAMPGGRGCDLVARRICKRAHAGVLEATARQLVVGEGRWDDRKVPNGFWWAEGFEALEQDWEAGDFSTCMTIKGREIEVRAFGVRFSRDGALDMGAKFGAGAHSTITLDMLTAALPDLSPIVDAWSEAAIWPWLDAALWIATRDAEAMKLLRGYRYFKDRSHSAEVGESACRSVILQQISEARLSAAEWELHQALCDGRLTATDETGIAVAPERWAAARPDPGEKIPPVSLSSADVLRIWSQSPADPAPLLEVAAGKRAGRGRRKGVGGYARADEPLVEEMRQLVQSGEAETPWAAAVLIAGKAKGSKEPEAREKRLVGRYYEKFPDA